MPKEKGPEWQHVIILDEDKDKQLSAMKLQCIYCDKIFRGGVARIKGHLFGEQGISKCSKVPDIVIDILKKDDNERQELKIKKRKLTTLDEASASTSQQSTPQQLELPAVFASNEKRNADKAIAKLFYAYRLPFAVADSKYFKEAVAAVSRAGPGYKPPEGKAISTTLLTAAVEDVKQNMVSYKQEAANTGVTLVSDGWTNVQNCPIINFLIVNGDGVMFVDAVDTSGATKDAKYIADTLASQIEALGKECVVQVVTDNASNCVAARKQLSERYPDIVFAACSAHCLDLLLEDIGKQTWASAVIQRGHDVVKFMTTHQGAHSYFRSHSNLELLKPVATRFASNFTMLQRLYECKNGLQETVVDRKYKTWQSNAKYKETGQIISEHILSNEFWQSVIQLISLCEPVISLLRLVDGHMPCSGKVYWKMFELCQKIEMSNLSSARRKQVHQFAMERWKMLHSDLHAAGFVLDPEYREYLQHENEEVIAGFLHAMLEKIYRNDVQAQVKAIEQHVIYRAGQGLFSRPLALAAAMTMPAHRWWMSFGAHVPELQKVAIRVLAHVSSVPSCGRNWSTVDIKHNRLQCTRARDVVYVHSNLRLKEKLDAVDYHQNTLEWNKHEHEVSSFESETDSD